MRFAARAKGPPASGPSARTAAKQTQSNDHVAAASPQTRYFTGGGGHAEETYAGYSDPSALFGGGFAEETYAGYSGPSTLLGGGHANDADPYSGYSAPLARGGGHGNETYSGYEAPPAQGHPDAAYSGYEASADGDGNVCVCDAELP